MAALRILIADEHCLVRQSLKTLLESHPGWEICAEARTGHEAVSAARKLKPDIAILDVSMPELNGPKAIKRIRRASPNTEILVLSMHHSEQLVREILVVGARGYLLKSESDRDLVIAVETIANHEPFPSPQATEALLTGLHTPDEAIRSVANGCERDLECGDFSIQEQTPEPVSPATTSFLAVDKHSPIASVDQADIERTQRELAELIALVEQPFQEQLVGINEGRPDDPAALDFIIEELFAIAVRFCKIDDRISDRAAHVCWKIFSYLAPSRYEGLTPTTMARLMSNMVKSVPQRYNSDLQTSSFLSVDLLYRSDQILGTNYAENLLDCLIRFTYLISNTHGIPPAKDESELQRTAELSETKHAILEDANLRAKQKSEFHQIVEVSETKQATVEDTNSRAKEESELKRMEETLNIKAAEDGAPQSSAVHDDLSKLSGTFKLAIEKIRAALRAILSETIALFSRIYSSFQNVKRWLNAPMK